MIRLTGATIVQPGGLLSPGTLTIEGDRIVEVTAGAAAEGIDLSDHYIVPGFVDVHVHGVLGVDALDGGDAVARIARTLPRFGVTAFCPTSIACAPAALRGMLEGIRDARATADPASSRVLPAHLESNFINPEFKGAQPAACLRTPHAGSSGDFSGSDILAEIDRGRADVGIITVAPEIDGVLDLIPPLVAAGHRVSLGHSGATYDEAMSAVAAGARHATHLFNRMSAFGHRAHLAAAARPRKHCPQPTRPRTRSVDGVSTAYVTGPGGHRPNSEIA
jgi:N-acetylglucosamine-6-phosphate deacetylase